MDVVEDVLAPDDPRLETLAVAVEGGQPGQLIRGIEDGGHLVERQVQLAQTGDRARPLELGSPVAPVAGRPIDLGRHQQAELVVVTQGADAQPRQPGESTDREDVVHATDRGLSGHPRVKPPVATRPVAVRRCRARATRRAG